MAGTLNRLDMRFRNQAGRIVTVRVLDPRTDLTETEVSTAMDTLLAKNVFASRRGNIVSKDSAMITGLTHQKSFSTLATKEFGVSFVR